MVNKDKLLYNWTNKLLTEVRNVFIYKIVYLRKVR